jgi:hypothetical protein
MARYNPDLMQLDDGATGAPRVAGPRNTAPISQEELDAENAKYDPATGMPLDLLESGIPELIQSFTKPGFTPGPYPKEFERFFGVADPNMIGYKIVTNEDGSQQLEVQTGAGSTITYGAPIKVGADGTVSTFDKGTKSNLTTATNNTTGTLTNPLDTTISDAAKAKRTSAYNTLYEEFDKYGLGSLVSDIKNYLIDNTFDPSEFSIQLQNTKAYQDRFSANKDRIAKGLVALRPADYIKLEDQYQNIMRNYGLPETYYTKGTNGVQSGFNQLIGNDVDSTELENRIITAQQRVINADPNVLKSLKSFYPDISNGDILAYTLDPKNGLDMIKRKVTAAEIGGAQLGAGLATGAAAAEALGAAGVTGAQYAQAAPFISQATQRGSQLSDIYGQGIYDQAAAEAEALNTAGGAQAAAKRKKLTALETAAFSGSSGVGALGRDKAIYGATQGQTGLY